MKRHWSEQLACRCGAVFRSYAAEARHRHNFPLLCRAPKRKPRAAVVIIDEASAIVPENRREIADKLSKPGG
jgi:hypothetical protein